MDHQQFHIEKITFLKTQPKQKCLLWHRVRITLLSANCGTKVRMIEGMEVEGICLATRGHTVPEARRVNLLSLRTPGQGGILPWMLMGAM